MAINMNNTISIAVITYNSEKTVVETLNSILNLNYDLSCIDLVISDDASQDNTVFFVMEWLDKYGSAFYSRKIIQHNENKGISFNVNSAWKACQGQWIKSIAGDDLLFPNCINSLIKHLQSNPSDKVIIAKQESFGFQKGIILPKQYDFFDLDSESQYRDLLIKGPFLPSPTLFINKSILIEVGFCNENYRWIEDYPLFLKLCKSGFKISFINELVVKYRVDESVTQSNSRYININSHLERERMRVDLVYDELKAIDITKYIFNRYEFYVIYMISKLSNNRKGIRSAILSCLFRPYRIFRFI